ncbi:aminopeptidase [Pilimelia terevasa]|uniref:Aminopeptidase n=1 Tax=Pilimelia terevasa TaxID=53372 RepID=A0A8J3FGF5_9ACTN|nr:M28 family peptidase [Pilimelia terevasa]GGK16677.1 aminopeptidase [Pilimelia terevasa]
MRFRASLTAGAAAVLAVAVAGVVGTAQATPQSAAGRLVPADPPAIPGDALMAHVREFQKIADANGGNRAHGRPGFRSSVDYVKAALDAAGYTTTLQTFTHQGATGWNVIAEWPHGDAGQTVMLGAHLDGVPAGPGINDNGSGSAALLENALLLARSDARPDKRLRFAWWGAEELGLVGSEQYLKQLAADDKKRISLYLNFDMVGVKNLKKWRIYKESPDVAATWKEHFRAKSITTEDYQASSDQLSFKSAKIKVSGFGGKSDDACYHKACDTVANVSVETLGVSANAIAAVSWKLAGVKTPIP